MKRIKSLLFGIMVLFTAAAVTSCSDDTEIDGVNLEGKWCRTDNPQEIDKYIELSKKTFFYYNLDNAYDPVNYTFKSATYSNGYIYTPQNATWSLEYKKDYEIIDKTLYVDGEKIGTIIVISKDKVRLESGYYYDGIYGRIKGFKSK